jgi:hypothetical protein
MNEEHQREQRLRYWQEGSVTASWLEDAGVYIDLGGEISGRRGAGTDADRVGDGADDIGGHVVE